jgi:glycosyltransferase involved in cell wall biosynthesis
MSGAASRVSLVLCVKDGMPYLPEALASVAAQTYRDFELIVQDCKSTDGTSVVLAGIKGLPRVDVVSELDSGIGDAYDRAVGRCRGEIIGSIDADNVLEPDALARAVAAFERFPEAAAVYGGCRVMDAEGTVLYPFMPQEFDALRLLFGELVPPFSVAFFSRRVCGEALRLDASLRTCADFDLWLRISDLPIVRIPEFLGRTRLSEYSMSRRADEYDQYIADKRTALENHLERVQPGLLTEPVRRRALAGLHLWAAEAVYDIEGGRSDRYRRYLAVAAELDPGSPWLARLRDMEETDAEIKEESPAMSTG